MTSQPSAPTGAAGSPVTDNKPPALSVPVASNVGKAPVKVTDSRTFGFNAGEVTPLEPLAVTKGQLGKPTTVVEANPGAIPKGQGTKVIATFRVGNDDVDTFSYKNADPKNPVPNGGGKFVCRIDTIDGPEIAHGKRPGQTYGPEATAYVQKLIDNKEVTIKVSGQDDKNRDICQVEINGVGLDASLVQAGAAMIYEKFVAPNHPRRAGLEAAQKEAKDSKRGIYGQDKPPVPPWDFRRSISNIPY